MSTSYMVGTDIGGTFTDLVLLEPGAEPKLFKSPTTPGDRSAGVVDALMMAAESVGLPLSEFCGRISYFAHGTTAATNALIERNGARTALLTTSGFGDTLLIQRSMSSWVGMGSLTGHYSRRRNPTPIVSRDMTFEVDERVDSSGEIVVTLDERGVRALVRQLRDRGVEALAVAFLWSFVRSDHEDMVRVIVQEEWPDVYLTLSHEIAPVLGEYERTATTVINSYLGPVIGNYIAKLDDKLRLSGYRGPVSIMDSGGGVIDAHAASRRSVALLTSGPAGGVLASVKLAAQLGLPNVITSDMGGTSFDVGLIVDGEPMVEQVTELGGYHLALSRIKVATIGAGGGSIAGVDEVGSLVVGPKSAGAEPGPACYGRGGELPTVTDADVVLGIIDPDFFLGGRMLLDRRLAEDAIRKHVAEPLGMTIEDAAIGIRKVADNQMADLLRKVTVEQGRDPRDFVVFAYGGAGPTHATAYTAYAGISTLVIPSTATVHSAYGSVTSDRFRAVQVSDVQRTPPGDADPASHISIDRLTRVFEELQARCHSDLDNAPSATFARVVYMRFRRQTHELAVPLLPGAITGASVKSLVEQFLETYERIYGAGTALPAAGLEISTLRVEGRVAIDGALLTEHTYPSGEVEVSSAIVGQREVYVPEVGRTICAVYRGELVGVGARFDGPAIVEFAGTTVVVGAGQNVRVDAYKNLIIDCGGAK